MADPILSWDRKFIALALHVAEWSKDRSTKVGCVIVGPDNDIRATGYNGFPRGLDDEVDARHERPAKYMWTEHAERNAIYNAARAGVSVQGCRLYLPWYPCVDCARAIIQSGLGELIAVEPDWNDPRWSEHFRVSQEMFEEVGLRCRWFDASEFASLREGNREAEGGQGKVEPRELTLAG